MSFLDRAISAISPRWGAKRAAWQAQENRIRGYDAASRTDPRNLGWVPDIGPAQLQITRDGALIRGRARELENNSDVVNAVIEAITRNIIGLGFELQAQTPSEKLNEKIEELWAEWCRPQNCDITGTQGFSSLLQMILRRKIVDGGILIQKVYARGSGPCTFRLQVLEVDSLTSPLVPHHKGNSVVDGIECDRYLRPRGYWVLPYQPDGLMYQQRTEPYYVAAKDMIFYFTKRRPTQVREVSDLVHVLERVRDANEFAKDVAEKQKVEAKFAAYITRTVDSGAGRGSFLRDQSEASTKHGYTEIAPGMIFDLNPGESMGALNPTGQGTDAATFMRLLLRLIAAGMGLSYEAVSRDMSGVNYSSARQSAIEDEVAFAAATAQFTDILTEIYETFVFSCVRSGSLDMAQIYTDKEKYLAHTWIKIPKRWVDPKKEAEANLMLVAAGLKTYQQAAAESGGDFKEILDSIKESLEYGDKIGVDVGRLVYDGRLEGEEGAKPGTAGPGPNDPNPGKGSAGDSNITEPGQDTGYESTSSDEGDA